MNTVYYIFATHQRIISIIINSNIYIIMIMAIVYAYDIMIYWNIISIILFKYKTDWVYKIIRRNIFYFFQNCNPTLFNQDE